MNNLKKSLVSRLYLFLFIGLTAIFFYPFIIFGKIPIPADTIVGMYHPWRDVVWDNLTAGVPFKNYLITDPVRQQYVWRNLAIEEFKKGNLPLWNPYSFAGTPFFANFQTGAFYPLNILFFILPFNFAWGILVLLQPLLAGVFLFLYLKEIKVSNAGSLLGGISFAFSGFSVAWLEWNTIGHVVLWLPLMLLTVEKLFKTKKIIWSIIFIFSLISSFFAGHLQVFFYSLLVTTAYISAKIIALKHNRLRVILFFAICSLLFVILTSVQWLPTLKFIILSARDFDQGSWMKPGWFIPWQNLLQFIVPDFFGNPATNNYWGIWNYAEFVGYIGIIPLLFALSALFFRVDKKVLFFGGLIFFSLIFALPTSFARLPYVLNIPFISTSQPTRLIFIIDFVLSVLAALGFDYFKNASINRAKSSKIILTVIGLLFIIFTGLWLILIFKNILFRGEINDYLAVSKRNLILPSLLFTAVAISVLIICKIKNDKVKSFIVYCIFFIIVFDLFRFGWKFTPFVKEQWLFPSTKITDTLKNNAGNWRLMSLDRRIMPPNFSTYYRLSDVGGYDPIYLLDYNQLVSVWETDRPEILPASFNRIVTPDNFASFITDLLGVKYILSLEPVKSSKLQLIASEGATYLYENLFAFPRVFFVEEILKAGDKQDEMEKMFSLKDKLRNIAVSREQLNILHGENNDNDSAEIAVYDNNYIMVKTKNETERLLVMTDIYYPSWKVYVDKQETKLYRVDFALRGVIVPAGEHAVEFKMNLI